jgi:hypothetical protein
MSETPKPACNHEKVFAPFMLCCFPPKREWICSICMEEGVDTVSSFDPNAFYRLKDQKSSGQ